MSGKKNQGQGAPSPAPTPETPPATVVTEPVAPDTVIAATPVGTLPAEPFEPPLPIPEANPDLSPEALREQHAGLSLAREKLEEDRQNLENEREALAKAREELENDRQAFEDKQAAALAELEASHGDLHAAREAFEESKRPQEPREPRIVKVRAVVGVTDMLRVQHRQPGEEFRLREDEAERLKQRGEIEILE